jgi:DNA repair protein RadC
LPTPLLMEVLPVPSRRVVRDSALPSEPVDDAPAYLAVKYWPASEQPREKLEAFGAGSLATPELLAIILRVGRAGESVLAVAQRLLVQSGGLAGVDRASLAELGKVSGIGRVKGIEIKAALELGRRLMSLAPEQQPEIRTPDDAYRLLQPDMQFLTREHLKTVLLNTKNRVQSIETVYEGSVNSANVRIAEVFREAIRRDCPQLIVAHNHPSGDPTPSPEDVGVTRQLVEAGKLLDIAVLDHIVVGHGRFVSLKQRGLGFS